jgi:hypothetical protein
MQEQRRARVIVCERTGKWARAIAPHLPAAAVLREVRGLPACGAELASAGASLVAVELEPERWPSLCQFLVELSRRFPRARAVVLANQERASEETAVREAGAVHWVVSTRRAGEVGSMAARHLGQFPPRLDGAHRGIWQRLPWKAAD